MITALRLSCKHSGQQSVGKLQNSPQLKSKGKSLLGNAPYYLVGCVIQRRNTQLVKNTCNTRYRYRCSWLIDWFLINLIEEVWDENCNLLLRVSMLHNLQIYFYISFSIYTVNRSPYVFIFVLQIKRNVY